MTFPVRCALIAMMTPIAAVSAQSNPRTCLMAAPRAVYAMPPKGFISGDEPNKMRACDAVTGEWLRGPVAAGDLAVDPAGPEGSGRYWTITVGLTPSRDAAPTRGICVETSTAGFRSLRSFGEKGLPWIADRDGDTAAEFVLWTSCFLTPRLQQSETGLAAWVYRADVKTGRLLLDLPLSRGMAAEVAAAYQAPLSEQATATAPTLAEERRLAAAALEAFAADRCTLPQEPRR